MKILFLSKRFYPEIGGVEKHVLKVSEELIKLGHNITIISEQPQEKQKENYQSNGKSASSHVNAKQTVKSSQSVIYKYKKINVIRFDAGKEDWFKKFRVWKWFIQNRKLISEFDVVHCHDVFYWYMPLRLFFLKKKVFTTFHGYETVYPPRLGAKLMRKISEMMSDGNICVGDYIKKWYGTKPDFVTYGAVDGGKMLRYKVSRNSIKNAKTNILILGRLEKDNGVDIYLDAIRKMKKDKLNFRLTVLGRGSYINKFRRLGVVEKLNFNTDKFIERTNFVFASSYLSIFEAIFRGKIVFATYNNQLKEDYLKLSPFSKFIEISPNVDDLVRKLTDYINNPDKRHEVSIRERKWAADYSWQKVAKIYLKLWEK